MPITSEPAPGSDMAGAPTCSPETSFGKYLRFCAAAADLVHAQIGMRAVREPDRGRGARDLFHGDDVREIAHRRAAVFLFHRDAQQAEVAELAPEIGREFVR